MSATAVVRPRVREISNGQIIGAFRKERRAGQPLILFCVDRTRRGVLSEREGMQDKVFDLLTDEERSPRFSIIFGDPMPSENALYVGLSKTGDIKFFSSSVS
jgi:hypothetical protein